MSCSVSCRHSTVCSLPLRRSLIRRPTSPPTSPSYVPRQGNEPDWHIPAADSIGQCQEPIRSYLRDWTNAGVTRRRTGYTRDKPVRNNARTRTGILMRIERSLEGVTHYMNNIGAAR
jgi:hypothetical protein